MQHGHHPESKSNISCKVQRKINDANEENCQFFGETYKGHCQVQARGLYGSTMHSKGPMHKYKIAMQINYNGCHLVSFSNWQCTSNSTVIEKTIQQLEQNFQIFLKHKGGQTSSKSQVFHLQFTQTEAAHMNEVNDCLELGTCTHPILRGGRQLKW